MSRWNRVFGLFSRPAEPELAVGSPGLIVVAEAFDAAEADSAVLARSHHWSAERPAVLRHHLTLPEDQVGEAERILAQDGWEVQIVSRSVAPEGPVTVHALRVQRLDALHCAQERARMAGLAQRLGGEALGWDAMQPEFAE